MKTPVRHVHFTRNEVDYLETAGFLPLTLLESLEDVRWQSELAGTLEVSTALVEEFREVFAERLAKAGFDEAYQPTAEGALLEDLIDRFHRAS